MFCDKYGRDTLCGTKIKIRTVTIHKTPIPVHYRASICGGCGEEVFDEYTEESIMRAARGIYRSKKSMLPSTALKDYMRKHDLTSAQMAEKVGCAVGEIIAASRGALLNCETDNMIRKIIRESA